MKPLFDQCRAYLLANAMTRPLDAEGHARPTVTISRETGAGAMSIGRLLKEYLEGIGADKKYPWAVFERNLVTKVLRDHQLSEALDKFMPEDAKPRVADLLEEILGVHPSRWSLVSQTNHTIYRLAMMGNVILVGRGSHLVTASLKNVLHVRLVAPLEMRIRNIQNYSHLRREDAVEFIRKGDQAKTRYLRRNFDWRAHHPLHFHLTINTGRISFPEAARLIGSAVLNLRIEQQRPLDPAFNII